MNYKIKINYLKIIIAVLIINFYFNAIFKSILVPIIIGGINLSGYLRFILLLIILFIIAPQLQYFNYVFNKNRKFVFIIFVFIIFLIIEIFFIKNKFLHIQGSIKFIFYFSCIIMGLYPAYYSSNKTLKKFTNLAIFLFFSVIIFYPYIIYKIGMNPFERILMAGDVRYGFLLQAGNEDAHIMVTLFPFILAKFYNKKYIKIFLIFILFLVLIYNGTRSALLSALFIIILFYYLSSPKKILFIILIILIFVIFAPVILSFVSIMFEKEKGVFLYTNRLLSGEYVGGNLSGRITYIWVPIIYYTINNSLFFGFGSNAWQTIAPKIVWASYADVTYSPHNLFVWIFANWGLLGLIIFIYLLYINFRYVINSYKKAIKIKNKIISISLMCSWFGFIIWSLIANSVGAHGWTVFTILILINISNKYDISK